MYLNINTIKVKHDKKFGQLPKNSYICRVIIKEMQTSSPGGSARECATGLYAGRSAGVKAAKVAGEGGHTAGLPGSGGYGSDHVHHTRKGIPFQGNSKGAGREV